MAVAVVAREKYHKRTNKLAACGIGVDSAASSEGDHFEAGPVGDESEGVIAGEDDGLVEFDDDGFAGEAEGDRKSVV